MAKIYPVFALPVLPHAIPLAEHPTYHLSSIFDCESFVMNSFQSFLCLFIIDVQTIVNIKCN